MADEQYRWLDRETAERLLSGEPHEAVDGAARGQAERLARTLGAISPSPPLTSEELPGEAAALAAFRKVRAERADAAGAAPATGRPAGVDSSGAGLVRIGAPRGSRSKDARRTRWARPARLGVAAALAVGMVGGVAVAAGTGVLKAPFSGDEPNPGASVSVGATPSEEPLLSPSPSAAAPGGATPGGSPSGTSPGDAGDSGRDEARGDAATKPGSGDPSGRPGELWKSVTSACRDVRDGKELNDRRKRVLEGAAGGSSRVGTYCKGILSTAGAGSADQKDEDESDAKSGKQRNGNNGEDGGGKGGDDDGHRSRRGNLGAPAAPPAYAPLLPQTAQAASPSPARPLVHGP